MITVWKLAQREQFVVQFSPDDDLVFDVRDLNADQWQRIEVQGGRALELATAGFDTSMAGADRPHA